ncbi:integral membrane protein [Penicillium herquei]|nr:integral membrane protein [Penicillium herquei]
MTYTNGIYPADLAVYLVLLPIVIYVFYCHRYLSSLPWYYMTIFCLARIVGGGMGVKDSSSEAAGIIQSVAITPLVLGLDGLTHEARSFRFPGYHKKLGMVMIVGTSVAMIAAIAMSITGALHVYAGKTEATWVDLWKAGSAVTVAVWGIQGIWLFYTFISRSGKTTGPNIRYTNVMLACGFVAFIFIGVRVIYTLVAVVTEEKKLSPIEGTIAVRIVLMFLPEAISTIAIVTSGYLTRHMQEEEKDIALQ